MKPLPALIIGCTAFFLFGLDGVQAGSKDTVNFYLTTPDKYAGKEIELDVVGVRPVRVKSPIPELAFFRAFSYDRREHSPGGDIVVAVDAASAEKFAKKYGDVWEGGRKTESLKGILLSAPAEGRQFWFVDTSGKANGLIAEAKASLQGVADDPSGLGGGPGGPPGGRGFGQRGRQGP